MVGRDVITKAAVEHWQTIYADEGSARIDPVPPDYASCITALRADDPKTTNDQLDHSCGQLYTSLHAKALEFLISARWLIGQAEEDGLPVDEGEARRRLSEASSKLLGGRAKFQHYLASTGKTTPDLVQEFQLEQVTEELRKRALATVSPITEAQIAAYYAQNRRSFSIPERRNTRIVRLLSAASAAKATRELRAGASFATVAVRASVPQPIDAERGLVDGLKPGFFQEPALSNAIFAALPGVLSGPVHINLGYYIFEVVSLIPAKQQTFAQVKSSIDKKLRGEALERALSDFAASWRKRWIARTSCRPGFIVRKCRQFKRSAATPPEPPDAFN
jgi:foldase protein PrsA